MGKLKSLDRFEGDVEKGDLVRFEFEDGDDEFSGYYEAPHHNGAHIFKYTLKGFPSVIFDLNKGILPCAKNSRVSIKGYEIIRRAKKKWNSYLCASICKSKI